MIYFNMIYTRYILYLFLLLSKNVRRLYPSIIIAYNLCFSTCVGIRDWTLTEMPFRSMKRDETPLKRHEKPLKSHEKL